LEKGVPIMSEDILSHVIDGFHPDSFHAGVNFAFAETVSYGAKKLALSEPYTDEQLEALLEPTRVVAGKHDLPIYVEREFLTTKLFDPAFTEGKRVILIAQSQEIIEEYLALKARKKRAVADDTLEEIDEEIAWSFGRLLGYSDEAIRRLLSKQAERSRGQ
jgi:hypothetical protein